MVVAAVIAFVDVGQGDCTVAIDVSTGAGILIDCPPGGSDGALRALDSHGATRLDFAILTHGDLDHAGGMLTVLDLLPPAEVRYNADPIEVVGPKDKPKLMAVFRGFLGLEQRLGVRLDGVRVGNTGSVGAITWSALAPTHSLITQAQTARSRNRASVVLRLDVAERRFLIAGDADGHVWDWLLANGAADIKADVFLVPHHGALLRTTAGRPSIEDVLAAVGASHHVISVATKNRHKLPSAVTLEAVRNHGGRLMCTEVNIHCVEKGRVPVAEGAALPPQCRIGRAATATSCPCAGTVTFQLDDEGWVTLPSVEEHEVVIGALAAPFCRPPKD